ncbi:Monomeric sarcosine oxidase [Pseudocercospora fuligena]|uniref:Monomeric sarcosine oxidase n=1 Tax=Pseudocercospora fuligena TaxID=685502 RepID=A0A8H6R847_9PEZI|nr:Monomeric sarcosine oxidase [Pseudocercospora fuligena]
MTGQNNKAATRLNAIQGHLQPNQYDVAVIGLGALGSSAAYQAAKRGVSVVGFEQFEFGHVRGASHDTSRIVRMSYELPQYVSLARLAYKEWAKLEEAAKQKILTITGGIVIFDKNGLPSGKSWVKALESQGLPYELLNAEQANKRWPQFHIKDHEEVIYTANTGMVHAAKSVAAFQHQARAHGADLKEHTRVESITPERDGVVIETSKGRFRARKVILAGDAWTNKLLAPLGAEIPLLVTQEQVTYFKPTNPENYEPDRFPVWIRTGKKFYYGFPCYGESTIKAGVDNTPKYTTADTRDFVPDPDVLHDLSATMQDFMPDPGREALRTATCLYTLTPDRQFVIAPVPKHENIIVTLASGHGFKFSPAFGKVAAQLAIDGKTEQDISLFQYPTPEVLADPRRPKWTD